MTSILIFGTLAAIYLGFNLFLTRRIKSAYYPDEVRREFRKRFIWLVPFVGPLMIVGSWRKRTKVKFDTMTKQQRDRKKGDFYESGIGFDA